MNETAIRQVCVSGPTLPRFLVIMAASSTFILWKSPVAIAILDHPSRLRSKDKIPSNRPRNGGRERRGTCSAGLDGHRPRRPLRRDKTQETRSIARHNIFCVMAPREDPTDRRRGRFPWSFLFKQNSHPAAMFLHGVACGMMCAPLFFRHCGIEEEVWRAAEEGL